MAVLKRILAVGVMVMALCPLLSGCFMRSPDELFAVPRQAEDYYNLQQAIDEVMQNATYSAPTGGDNRQSVQMKDLDGDGANEAILFAKAEGELPLKIHVFRRENDAFSQIACFEGDGSGFDSVQFVQIDGKDGLEMIVCRQLSEGVPQMVCVYGFVEDGLVELYSGSFRQMRVLDMNDDGTEELFLLRDNPDKRQAETYLYDWQNGQLLSAGPVDASCPADRLIRLQVGKTADDRNALYVTQSVDELTAVTDVFVWVDHQFYNASALAEDDVLQPYPIVLQPTDILGDDYLMLPHVLSTGDNANSLLANWYGIHSDGTLTSPTLCCHHADGAWSMTLNGAWQDMLVLRCTDTETYHLTTFSRFLSDSGEEELILSIYAYFGTDAEAWAVRNNCFELDSKAGVHYYAAFGDSVLSRELDRQGLAEHFHMQKESAE